MQAHQDQFFKEEKPRETLFAYRREFNDDLFRQAEKLYSEGGCLYATYLGYSPEAKTYLPIKQIELPTLEKFSEFVWDAFDDFSIENGHRLLFGAAGLKADNPFRRAEQCFYDGMIYGVCSDEYRKLVNTPAKELTIPKLLSMLIHFGYHDFYFTDKKFT